MASKATRTTYIDVSKVVKNTNDAAVLAVANVGAGRAVKLAPVDKGILRSDIAAFAVKAGVSGYGSNLIYAPVQEFGGGNNIPAQPYLRPSADWLKTNGSKAYATVLKGALRRG